MKNRYLLSAVVLTAGVALLVATAFAGAASSAPAAKAKAEARGGTLRIDTAGGSDFDFIDPQLAYFSHSWQLGNAVQLHLLGYPDKEGAEGSRLRAEAATGLPAVSKDGKTYTFKIKPGFLFSDGKPVTAANFAASIQRALNPKMNSPAASFVEDIVGGKAVLDGKAASASGVSATGQTLTIKLTKVAPDFLARMTMEFFPAIPANTPIVAEGIGAPMVSAGPYYVKEWVKSRTATVVRNPNWNNAKEPWKSLGRPANVDAMQITIGNTPDAIKLRLDTNQTDLGGIPPAAIAEVVQKYGINKGRFFLRKELVFWYLALNHDRVFKDTKLAQAVNWAIDRPQMVRQWGYLAGARTDQILPPGMPGYKDWNIYPLAGVNQTAINKAKSLLAGSSVKNVVFYTSNRAPAPQVAQVVQFNLKQVGIDAEIKQFDRVVEHQKVATRGEPFDIAHAGWGADYPDPSNFINVLFDGTRILETNNVNESYFNDPAYNKRMAEASVLSGDQRLKSYGELDRDLTKVGAAASYFNRAGRIYVSDSLGCFQYSPVHSTTNLVSVCKK